MRELTPIIAAIVSFLVTAGLGYIVIPFLHKLKFGQTILEIGPKWHKEKQGTPTMGGIMMVAGILVAIGVSIGYSFLTQGRFFEELKSSFRLTVFIAGIVMALCMCAIGFFDDYIKVVKKRNLGLSAKQKTFLQLLVAAGYLATLALSGMNTTYIPFIGDVDVMHGVGIIFWPIALIFIYGFTNAVNLTDGVDGLASAVTMVVACAFMLGAGLIGNISVNMLSAALAGACVGFVFWNAKPAKVFMGDTGSMFLGGMVVAISFGIGRPLMLIFAGCIYFIEALSVMLQVAYYKKTKKRLFKMSPLHHHFEMCGWSEDKVVLVFSAVTLVGCVISLLPLILNF
ncbi:MAG: phospho-N-acetylmuramoyl-pentapeptide-transferase [Clostridia bacterium]|nr:phospho-N-acetylmuramoyl-pentapeptide-transferase [Clostridia bacterium]MBQ2236993.1 phospho-N-acetylmuramoyl-pentapeptide-transferase [Clostridia bacterium]MEE1185097.1 phospho-N-acetylmuramoyl-pentapeptide-transferase [Acutalibacteraceae bacterium]